MINITKKEQLTEIFEDAIKLKSAFIAVEVRTVGSEENEIIINPCSSFKRKLKYYQNNYNDDLVLNTYSGISIISAISLDSDSTASDVTAALEVMRFV